MIILGLESTCDESSASVIRGPRELLSNVVKSQIDEHRRFGGVVPEIASRLHLNYLASAMHEALEKAEVTLEEVDLIGVSTSPGLVGGLLVGSTLAKTLSYTLNKPWVGVDHLFGHLLAPDLVEPLEFPCVAGVFSGAHSNVYLGKSYMEWQLLARSRDDAPGEAFDKTAKLLDLPYPGGPSIQKYAEQGQPNIKLPEPLPKSLEGDFSFSGLKTSVLYTVQGQQNKAALDKTAWPDLAASFQETVAGTLAKSLLDHAEAHEVKNIYIGGGVAANRRLREILNEKGEQLGYRVHFPPMPLCMDNGAMIARAALVMYENGHQSTLDEDIQSRSNLGF
jgi:N6-L-threonylcarbamoyladenine synthase